MLFTDEIWRPVPGSEGAYEVSSMGRVRNQAGRLLSQSIRKRGVPYRTVLLRSALGGVRRTVHGLVLHAFKGQRPVGLIARHLNGDASNNRDDNLNWGTVAENVADRAAHVTENAGERNHKAKLTRTQVDEIRSSHAKQSVLAQLYAVSQGNISSIRSGRIWK